jgi:hypothetical protein
VVCNVLLFLIISSLRKENKEIIISNFLLINSLLFNEFHGISRGDQTETFSEYL